VEEVEIKAPAQESFYRCAMLGLRALDAAGAQRRFFGAEADATWSAMVGALRPSDRLDLLIRNAAVANPAAFAPRVIFPLPGLADDEPFGPDWRAPAGLAEQLLREAVKPAVDASPAALLVEAAKAWGLAAKPARGEGLASLTPASRVLVAGAGAILAVAARFHGREGFDLGRQVALVSALPGERQLLGLAAALLGSAVAPPMLAPGITAKEAGATPISLTVVHVGLASPESEPRAAETVAALARDLRA
jgi:hypothetical protein